MLAVNRRLRRPALGTNELSCLHSDDTSFFERLWRETEPDLRCLIARYARDPTDIDELLQAVCIRAWERRRAYKGRGSFAAWLVTISTHLWMDLCRRRAAEHRRGARLAANAWLFAEVTPAEEHEALRDLSDTRCAQVRAALGFLSPRDRDLAMRRWVLGEKPRSIALALGLTRGSVCSRLCEIRCRLRAMLARFAMNPPPGKTADCEILRALASIAVDDRDCPIPGTRRSDPRPTHER